MNGNICLLYTLCSLIQLVKSITMSNNVKSLPTCNEICIIAIITYKVQYNVRYSYDKCIFYFKRLKTRERWTDKLLHKSNKSSLNRYGNSFDQVKLDKFIISIYWTHGSCPGVVVRVLSTASHYMLAVSIQFPTPESEIKY